jgi:hypothetical protein
MELEQIINLILKSSDHNPYSGKLSERDNYIAAIDLAELCKDFADKGMNDEAMNIPVEQWVEVINNLKSHPTIKAPLSN